MNMILSLSADGVPSLNQAVSSEELLKITEEQIKAAATQQPQQQGEASISVETSTESPSKPQLSLI